MPDNLPECFPPVEPGETTGPLVFDGERPKWTAKPVDGKVPVWSDAIKDFVYVDPANLCAGIIQAGAPKEKGPPPRKLPDLDEKQPM